MSRNLFALHSRATKGQINEAGSIATAPTSYGHSANYWHSASYWQSASYWHSASEECHFTIPTIVPDSLNLSNSDADETMCAQGGRLVAPMPSFGGLSVKTIDEAESLAFVRKTHSPRLPSYVIR